MTHFELRYGRYRGKVVSQSNEGICKIHYDDRTKRHHDLSSPAERWYIDGDQPPTEVANPRALVACGFSCTGLYRSECLQHLETSRLWSRNLDQCPCMLAVDVKNSQWSELQVCAICGDFSSPEDGSDPAEQMIFCDGCNVAVHAGCWGPVWHGKAEAAVNQAHFLCPACSVSAEEGCDDVRECAFCPNTGGALFRVIDGRWDGQWAHISCVRFNADLYMSPSNAARIESDGRPRRVNTCSINGCPDPQHGRRIACIGSCGRAAHVTCVQRPGSRWHLEEIEDETGEGAATKVMFACDSNECLGFHLRNGTTWDRCKARAATPPRPYKSTRLSDPGLFKLHDLAHGIGGFTACCHRLGGAVVSACDIDRCTLKTRTHQLITTLTFITKTLLLSHFYRLVSGGVEKQTHARSVYQSTWRFNVPSIDGLKNVDFKELPWADMVTCGFPCTDFSAAGKGLGGFDFFKLLCSKLKDCKCKCALLENVPELLSERFKFGEEQMSWLADAGFPHCRIYSVRAAEHKPTPSAGLSVTRTPLLTGICCLLWLCQQASSTSVCMLP